MSNMPVVTGKDTDVLRTVAEPVERVDDAILQLAAEMRETMKAEKGVGLAAPQVGVSKRIILATIDEVVTLMVNPEILSFSAETEICEEGCLSLPGEWGNVSRAKRIKLKYLNEDGEQVQTELVGLNARVVQHEIDHLNGVLFVDRLVTKSGVTIFQTQ